ncbi:MAG: hypothetical protein ACRDRS_12545 [Pseudonocardiaceae bacterium]
MATCGDPVTAAVGYLLRHQDRVSWWSDFNLAPGPSTEWVTAYVASALCSSGQPAALEAAGLAWRALAGCAAEGGWGYNGWTPRDADSTAWAVWLAITLGQRSSVPAVAADLFLACHQTPDGGLATYRCEAALRSFTGSSPTADLSGWLASHVCVTAAAACLPGWERLLPYLRDRQWSDGRWSSYWWIDDAYATAFATQALACSAEPDDTARLARAGRWALDELRRTTKAGHQPSPFAVALTLQALHYSASACVAAKDGCDRAVAWLVSRQHSNGSWTASAQLRVPPPDVHEPVTHFHWEVGGRIEGALVVDQAAVFTTATVLRALSLELATGRPLGQTA